MTSYLPRLGSKLNVWTYKEGLLSRVAHDLCFRAERFEAPLTLEGDAYSVEVTVPVRGLRVEGQVKKGKVVPLRAKDHTEIESNLAGARVLDAAAHPEVRFTLSGTKPAGERTEGATGDLTLRGRTKPVQASVSFEPAGDGWRVSGEVELRQTEFGISPFSAMMGALKVQDRVRVSWEVEYAPEES